MPDKEEQYYLNGRTEESGSCGQLEPRLIKPKQREIIP
jgi:hypothetical protein